MLSIKLAIRNLIGAGLKTWLNVIVLSMSFVLIIFYNGMMDGWNKQASTDTIAWEIGQGQVWQKAYDPYDPFTLQDAHGRVPTNLQNQVQAGTALPILITQATLYPQGRMQSMLLKGIPSNQKLLKIPSQALQKGGEGQLPAVIGKRMAESTKLKIGDRVLMRWRDSKGTFDAREIHIVDVFDCNVPSVDNGQVWIDLEQMRTLTRMDGEATLLVTNTNYEASNNPNWLFQSKATLLSDLTRMVETEKVNASIMYILLMGIALLAIFDTQVLSIFRRQKEIGTYIALGMTRLQVVKLFTIEGGAHSILAILVGALYGIPLFYYFSQQGIPMPAYAEEVGVSVPRSIFPIYGVWLVGGTMLLIIIASTIVSYLPARKIAKIKPTEALKGKVF